MIKERKSAKLTFYTRRQSKQNKVGARVATADHVGGKHGSEVNLTNGRRRPVEIVWCLSSLMSMTNGRPLCKKSSADIFCYSSSDEM